VSCFGVLGACAPSHQPVGATVLVVGVQSEDMGGLLGAVHITTTVGGAPASDDTLTPPNGNTQGFPAPWEKRLTAPANATSAPVHVEVDGFQGSSASGMPLLTRTADSQFVPGATKLLRIRLETRCLVFPPTGVVDGGPPGPLSGPTCTAPGQSCIGGLCQSDSVAPFQLESYTPDWPQNQPDICKPANAGPPQVLVGSGQTDYAPVMDGQTLQAELGPQGGHHVWIAVRMRNLRQSGSTTKIQGVQPGTNVAIPPSAFVFTYDMDEGGYCKLYGLRYQLDNGGIDYTQFLGKPLDISAVVTDTAGVTATGVAHVNIAPTILMP
jgi:hypothetical protein